MFSELMVSSYQIEKEENEGAQRRAHASEKDSRDYQMTKVGGKRNQKDTPHERQVAHQSILEEN